MQSSSLIAEAVQLMLYGMGVVFVFLLVLIGATMAMSRLAGRSGAGTGESSPPAAPPGAPANDKPQRTAAASAAVHHHRKST